jgi:hypothetical protein
VSTRKGNDGIKGEGPVKDKLCLATIDTEASVMIVRPDITEGLTQPYVLQMASRVTLSILTLGRYHPLMTWTFATIITDDFIQGPDVLCAHNVWI